MGWVTITDGAEEDTVWQYDNSATASDTYSSANGETGNGIRRFTLPGGTEQEIYVKCRKVGETTERGELSKTFYDALNA